MKNSVLTFALTGFLFLGLSGHAQTAEEAVTEKVNQYFDGYAKGDTTLLSTVFHPGFVLSWKDPWRKAFAQVDRKGLFGFFDENWSKLRIHSEIVELHVLENSAYCLAQVTLEGIVVWTDHISLLKLNNDQWWIVSKTSEGKLIH